VKQLLKDIGMNSMTLLSIFRSLLRSGIITMATRAPVRIGFRGEEGSSLFYNVRVKVVGITLSRDMNIAPSVVMKGYSLPFRSAQ
jgi:ADP-heptose:LPS heptosyltransferase